MTAGKLNRYWALIIILLVAIIVVGGVVIWSRYSPDQPIEIAIPPGQEQSGRIYIDGNVTTPGFYPLRDGESLEALIQAAGGTTGSVNLSRLELKLYISSMGLEEPEAQKIDINQAEVWLLEALPGIGETLAQRIVAYRQQNGSFRNINEIIGVNGIGTGKYDQIKHLITVSD